MYLFRKLAVTLGLAVLLLTLLAPTAMTAPAASQATNGCNGVFNATGSDGSLTKTLTGLQDNGDGTFTLTYNVTTTRPFGSYRLRECAIQDVNGNQRFDAGEPVLASVSKNVSIGVPSTPSTQVSVTVTGEAGDVVCDRVDLSGQRSNVDCTTLTTTPVPVGAIGGIGLTVLAAGGFTVAQLRSRRRRRAAVPAG
jgi:hypothetical protein